MPGCAVHFRLALEVLARWRRTPADAPFPVTDPAARNAFLNGCNAPDMGYFPGGVHLLTDYSHYIRSGGLARSLVNSAANDVERAFAWGWVTHVLGDALIHPLVNQAAGELLTGDRNRPATYADDPAAHVRVEMGADAYLYVADPPGEDVTTRPAFDAAGIGYLEGAYRETYGVPFDRDQMLAAHRAVARFTPWLLATDRVAGRRFHGRWLGGRTLLLAWGVYDPARICTGLFGRKSFTYALTHTVRPSAWFVDAIRDVVGTFAVRYHELYSTRLADLPDYNLDTGAIEGTSPTYPPAVKAFADLEAKRATAAGKA